MGKVYVVMGVSGSGKSTIAEALAKATGGAYYDADDFHPPANVEKMSSGHPLTDDDRWGWLDQLANLLEDRVAADEFTFVACSALKQIYRDRLRKQGQLPIGFIFLRADATTLEDRMNHRVEHFMPPTLLASQMATLEEPKHAITVDAALPVAEIVSQVLQRITT